MKKADRAILIFYFILDIAFVHEADDTVEDLRVERPSLEERFLELVEGAE